MLTALGVRAVGADQDDPGRDADDPDADHADDVPVGCAVPAGQPARPGSSVLTRLNPLTYAVQPMRAAVFDHSTSRPTTRATARPADHLVGLGGAEYVQLGVVAVVTVALIGVAVVAVRPQRRARIARAAARGATSHSRMRRGTRPERGCPERSGPSPRLWPVIRFEKVTKSYEGSTARPWTTSTSTSRRASSSSSSGPPARASRRSCASSCARPAPPAGTCLRRGQGDQPAGQLEGAGPAPPDRHRVPGLPAAAQQDRHRERRASRFR